MLSVEFPNTVNGSAVHYPPIAMLCPGDPELQAPSPGAHSFRGKICRYLNSQLQCCVLSVLREGQTRCCGEVDLGDWSRSDRCQGPVRPREGEGHPGRGNSMGKGMEPWMHTLHAGRSAWLRHVRWGSREGDEAEEEGDVGSWKGFRFYALGRKEMRGAHFVFKRLTVG